MLAPEDDAFGEEDGAMEVVGGEGERRAKGTINRKLWKQMCRKIAQSVSFIFPEQRQSRFQSVLT